MALREEVVLDVQNALRELERIRQQLSELGTPVQVPVNIEGEEALARLDQQVRDAGGIVDVDVDQSSLQGAESTVEGLNRELDQTADELQRAAREADEFGDELDSSGQRGVQAVGGIRSALGPLLAGAVAGIGFGALVDQFNQAIESATNLEESINAVNVTFLEGADTVRRFGEDAAQNVGLAASEFNQLVTPIGALLQNFNLDGREAADAAVELTTRAADLASVFNTDVQDALAAIGSALRGETEPIRAFGVNLNQAALDAKALELGLVQVGEEVSIAERGQAAYALVLEQTARFAGDFTRTADSAANRQRILTAEFEDARAELGQALLPAFESLLDLAPDFIATLEDMAPALGTLATAFGDTVTAAGPFFDILGQIASEIGGVTDAAGEAEGITLFDIAIPFTLPGALGFISEGLLEIDRRISRGFTDRQLQDFLDDLGTAAEDAEDPMALLQETFEGFAESGADAVPVLEEIAGALGLSDEQLGQFVQGLLLSSGSLDLTVDQVTALRDILEEIGGVQPGAPLEGLLDLQVPDALEGLSPFVTDTLVGFDQIEEGVDDVSQAFEDIQWDAPPPENVPVIIDDLFELADAASDAGVSMQEFVESTPEGFVLDLSDAEAEVLGLIENLGTLEERLGEFAPENVVDLSEFINEDTGELEADLGQIRQAIDEQIGAEAEFQLDLSQIAVVAPDIAAILEAEGIDVAADVAAQFAEDLEEAGTQQALIDGTEGLAAATAENYADFLKSLTPGELERVAAFGPDNLVPALQNELIETANAVAADLARLTSDALSNTTIAPSLIIDLSNSQIIGEPGGGGGGSRPPVTSDGEPIPGSLGFEVNIINPTTEDLSTSATQAGQTIQAVSQTIGRVR